jgi:hypothetical protein
VAGSRTFEKKKFSRPQERGRSCWKKMQVSKTWQVSELYEMKYDPEKSFIEVDGQRGPVHFLLK